MDREDFKNNYMKVDDETRDIVYKLLISDTKKQEEIAKAVKGKSREETISIVKKMLNM